MLALCTCLALDFMLGKVPVSSGACAQISADVAEIMPLVGNVVILQLPTLIQRLSALESKRANSKRTFNPELLNQHVAPFIPITHSLLLTTARSLPCCSVVIIRIDTMLCAAAAGFPRRQRGGGKTISAKWKQAPNPHARGNNSQHRP